MITGQTWHMTDSQQTSSLAIIIIAVVIIIIGAWALAVDAKDRWSIEDAKADLDELADDLLHGRDNHLGDDRAAMQAARLA